MDGKLLPSDSAYFILHIQNNVKPAITPNMNNDKC
jgi:hypothetical protein